MSELKLFVNEKHHTGEYREATRELLDSGIQVVERCVNNVRDFHGMWDGHPGAIDWPLRRFTSSKDFVGDRLRHRWERNEKRILGILVFELKRMGLGSPVDERLMDSLIQLELFNNTFSALKFWRYAEERMHFLQSERADETLGTISLVSYSYIESRLLDLALRGVYLTRANTN